MVLYGVFLDHARAFLIKADPKEILSIHQIDSGVEPHHHSGVRQEHVTITNQHRDDERRKKEMKIFCKEILKSLQDADEVIIFGPGNAKFELKIQLEEKKSFATKLKSVETTDKMTEAELRAYVKKQFHLPRI